MRLVLLLSLCSTLIGADRFEVTSVRVADPSVPWTQGTSPSGGPGTDSPERITWRRTPLGILLRSGAGLGDAQIVAPNWVMFYAGYDTIYDISASVPLGTTREQLRGMILHLLEDRFGMTFHREMQERTVYALRVAPGGLKLKLSDQDPSKPSVGIPITLSDGSSGISLSQGTMKSAATMIQHALVDEQAVVVDQTGLDGVFTAALKYADPLAQGAFEESLPSALEHQWGLKLERSKAQVEVFVVDAINKVPTEN